MSTTTSRQSSGRRRIVGRRPDPGMRTVRVLGQTVRVHVRPGNGAPIDRPPLLLCNGIGTSLEVLNPLVAELDPASTVIRFDVPGVGSSSTPLLPYRYSAMAGLVSSLLDALEQPYVDVLGFSWGGGLAQQFAFQHRSHCRRLVLASTATGMIAVPGKPKALSKMLTPRRHRDAGYAASIAPDLYGGTMRTDPRRAERILGGHTRAGTTRGYLFQLTAGIGWSSLPMLPFIRQDTLLVSGDDDPIVPLANARILSLGIPRARLHIFRGGHVEPLIEAESIAPHISEFLLEGK